MKRITVALIALALTAPAWAGNKSSTSSVIENRAQQSWTQKCTVKKIGVNALQSYSGLAWIRYNDPNGEQEFFRRNWSVGPGATTFTETSVGLYSLTATLKSTSATSATISLTFSATRYGPLTAKVNDVGAVVGYGGTFTCMGAILVGNDLTGSVVHNVMLEERIGAWQ